MVQVENTHFYPTHANLTNSTRKKQPILLQADFCNLSNQFCRTTSPTERPSTFLPCDLNQKSSDFHETFAKRPSRSMESTKYIILPIDMPRMYPIIDQSNRNRNNFRTQRRPNNLNLNPLAEYCDPTKSYFTAFSAQLSDPPIELHDERDQDGTFDQNSVESEPAGSVTTTPRIPQANTAPRQSNTLLERFSNLRQSFSAGTRRTSISMALRK